MLTRLFRFIALVAAVSAIASCGVSPAAADKELDAIASSLSRGEASALKGLGSQAFALTAAYGDAENQDLSVEGMIGVPMDYEAAEMEDPEPEGDDAMAAEDPSAEGDGSEEWIADGGDEGEGEVSFGGLGFVYDENASGALVTRRYDAFMLGNGDYSSAAEDELAKRELRLLEKYCSECVMDPERTGVVTSMAVVTALGNLAIFPVGDAAFPGPFFSGSEGSEWFSRAGSERVGLPRKLDSPTVFRGMPCAVLLCGAELEGGPQALVMSFVDLSETALQALRGKKSLVLVAAEGGLPLAATDSFRKAFPSFRPIEEAAVPDRAAPATEERKRAALGAGSDAALAEVFRAMESGAAEFKVRAGKRGYAVKVKKLSFGMTALSFR